PSPIAPIPAFALPQRLARFGVEAVQLAELLGGEPEQPIPGEHRRAVVQTKAFRLPNVLRCDAFVPLFQANGPGRPLVVGEDEQVLVLARRQAPPLPPNPLQLPEPLARGRGDADQVRPAAPGERHDLALAGKIDKDWRAISGVLPALGLETPLQF